MFSVHHKPPLYLVSASGKRGSKGRKIFCIYVSINLAWETDQMFIFSVFQDTSSRHYSFSDTSISFTYIFTLIHIKLWVITQSSIQPFILWGRRRRGKIKSCFQFNWQTLHFCSASIGNCGANFSTTACNHGEISICFIYIYQEDC